jgi:hypothetical protein
MTRRKEKWCVPGYQASQRGRFSSSVALTPQFKDAVAMHLRQRTSLLATVMGFVW